MSMDAHFAVQTVELRHVRETVERIEGQLGAHVSRTEWEQRNGYVDGKFDQVRGEVGAVKRQVESARAPWWSVVTSVAAVAALLITLIPLIAK